MWGSQLSWPYPYAAPPPPMMPPQTAVRQTPRAAQKPPAAWPRLQPHMRVLTVRQEGEIEYKPVVDSEQGGVVYYQCPKCNSTRLFRRIMDLKKHFLKCKSFSLSPGRGEYDRQYDTAAGAPEEVGSRTSELPQRQPKTYASGSCTSTLPQRLPQPNVHRATHDRQQYDDEYQEMFNIKQEANPAPPPPSNGLCRSMSLPPQLQKSLRDEPMYKPITDEPQLSQQPTQPTLQNEELFSQFTNFLSQMQQRSASLVPAAAPPPPKKPLWEDPIMLEYHEQPVKEASVQCQLIPRVSKQRRAIGLYIGAQITSKAPKAPKREKKAPAREQAKVRVAAPTRAATPPRAAAARSRAPTPAPRIVKRKAPPRRTELPKLNVMTRKQARLAQMKTELSQQSQSQQLQPGLESYSMRFSTENAPPPPIVPQQAISHWPGGVLSLIKRKPSGFSS